MLSSSAHETRPPISRSRPVPGEHRCDLRMGFDTQQGFVKYRARLLQMLSRPRPFRDDGGEDVERANRFSAEIGLRGKQVGEYFPVPVQACTRAGPDALLHGFIGILAPALGEIDDADRGI